MAASGHLHSAPRRESEGGYHLPSAIDRVTEATASEPLEAAYSHSSRRRSSTGLDSSHHQHHGGGYHIPQVSSGVPEAEAVSPLESPQRTRHSLPDARLGTPPPAPGASTTSLQDSTTDTVSGFTTEFTTIAYLVFFAILGTLARLGLQALTAYPGTPTIFSSLWPNFAGCLVMGFLAEDRMLFRDEWGLPTKATKDEMAADDVAANNEKSDPEREAAVTAARKAHLAVKKTIPLYIGLATGFCGSFTSFSSFMRDIFLALSNDLTSPGLANPTIPLRNGGYSFMALLSVTVVTIALSLSGLFVGAHTAVACEPYTPSIPFRVTSKILDRAAFFLGFGSWLGAVLLSALPPDRFDTSPASERWRGSATFALVFAPLGCLLRFYVSAWLNSRRASFPMGTFAVNILGTAVLGMAWDVQHVPVGGAIGCQVLQGIEDGFCGCLTTVSTWAAELAGLRRRDAYVYGGASVAVGFAVMVLVMGGLRWTEGFSAVQCVH